MALSSNTARELDYEALATLMSRRHRALVAPEPAPEPTTTSYEIEVDVDAEDAFPGLVDRVAVVGARDTIPVSGVRVHAFEGVDLDDMVDDLAPLPVLARPPPFVAEERVLAWVARRDELANRCTGLRLWASANDRVWIGHRVQRAASNLENVLRAIDRLACDAASAGATNSSNGAA